MSAAAGGRGRVVGYAVADWWSFRGNPVRRYLVTEVREGQRPVGLVTEVRGDLDVVCEVCDRLNAAWRGYIGLFRASLIVVGGAAEGPDDGHPHTPSPPIHLAELPSGFNTIPPDGSVGGGSPGASTLPTSDA